MNQWTDQSIPIITHPPTHCNHQLCWQGTNKLEFPMNKFVPSKISAKFDCDPRIAHIKSAYAIVTTDGQMVRQ